MKIRFAIYLLCLCSSLATWAYRWDIGADGHAIEWCPGADIPHRDCVEMTGQATSLVYRWGVDANGAFTAEKSLIFPLLRTIPNDTHASLVWRISTDIPSMICINGRNLQAEKVRRVRFDGTLGVESDWTFGDFSLGDDWGTNRERLVAMKRTVYPSRTKPLSCERYVLTNRCDSDSISIFIPDFRQVFTTNPENGVEGAYNIRCDITGTGSYPLAPGDSITFYAVYQGLHSGDTPLRPDCEAELAGRRNFIDNDIARNLVLETPDSDINTAFHFSKLRAAESIIRTRGGLMHAPGGEVFYAAIWTNDQCEYVIPFFPFLGYELADSSAVNTFRHYARFINDEYRPIPSSIIAEGTDIWNGAGDRGDAAMCAAGASRFALARSNTEVARQLWPLIEWCLEYCRRNLTKDGVVASDCDELEGRIPVGRTNLATSSLYYDALLSSAYLAEGLAKSKGLDRNKYKSLAGRYRKQAKALAENIERFFGREVAGFHAYRYSEANDKLRAWMCMPLVVDIDKRRQGTVDALLSPALYTRHGILTVEGDSVYWDRSSLYSLRAIFRAQQPDRALSFLHDFSGTRLRGEHVPYFIEAWPEGDGSMRQLSAESGLYCRIFTEGLFGIRPTGLRSFDISPSLPSSWDKAALRDIKAFGTTFDIELQRRPDHKILITVLPRDKKKQTHIVKAGQTASVTL